MNLSSKEVSTSVKELNENESPMDICGNIERPGYGLDAPRLMDYSQRETTIDQLNIQTVLSEMDLEGLNLLHVGIGNSSIAKLFGDKAKVDGISVAQNEMDYAHSLEMENYRVYLINKYSRDFDLTIKEKYDIIVDNNLASFSCCIYHFYRLMENYAFRLKPSGKILTDQFGMDYGGGMNMKLTYDDLLTFERKFGLKVTRLSETVYSLSKGGE